MAANTSAASAYLQQHQIPRILEDVIAKLVSEKPQDPFSFLVSSPQLPPHAALLCSHPFTHSLSCLPCLLHAMLQAEQFRALAGSGSGGRKPRVVFVLGGPGAGKGRRRLHTQ